MVFTPAYLRVKSGHAEYYSHGAENDPEQISVLFIPPILQPIDCDLQ